MRGLLQSVNSDDFSVPALFDTQLGPTFRTPEKRQEKQLTVDFIAACKACKKRNMQKNRVFSSLTNLVRCIFIPVSGGLFQQGATPTLTLTNAHNAKTSLALTFLNILNLNKI